MIDFTTDVVKDGEKAKIYNAELDKLGFVTSSCVLFTMNEEIKPSYLFKRREQLYLKRKGYA